MHRAAEFAKTQAHWARLLMASVADAGVREVIVSPGSRSTPFLLAADAEPRLALRDIVDERAAAFFALGQARVSGRPSLLLCTSGTAAAHYLPAVIEARMTGVPMLILSADRPLELLDCGANQAIDQNRLFGNHAKAFFELGVADDAPGALRGLKRRVAQAVMATTWPQAGAVQLNARARKPLEPPKDEPPQNERPKHESPRNEAIIGRSGPRPRLAERHPRSADLDALATDCRRFQRGLIVAGPAAIAQRAQVELVAELSRRTGFPLLADLASQLRRAECLQVPAFETILRRPIFDPQVVVQIGRTPTTTAWVRRLAEKPPEVHWVLGAEGWHDPESTATDLLFADVGPILQALLEGWPGEDLNKDLETTWTRRWRQVAAHTAEALGSVLELGGPLSEAQVTAESTRAVPEGGLLKLGNSLVIRHADLYGDSRPGVDILSQRGASGIDGLVAGAAGAASSGRPTLVLLGDVSLQHDLGGLATAPRDGTPFVVTVIDNGGGRIFEQLPIADRIDPVTFDHWLTPAVAGTRDFAHAAAYAGFEHRAVTCRSDLQSTLREAFATGGPWLIVARVPSSGAVELKERLASEIDRRLAEAHNLGPDF